MHPNFSIYGSDLLVQMHYVDADFLQVSVTILVYQLTLLMQSKKQYLLPMAGPFKHVGLSRLIPELPPMLLKSSERFSLAATGFL